MAAKNQTLATALLDHVLRNTAYVAPATVYAALYTVAPTPTTQGTEVTTAGGTLYNRIAATFGAAAAGSISNSGAVTFPVAGAGWGLVVAASICASGVPGTNDALYFGNLAANKNVGVGDQLSFAIGALVVTES
jgi:hypothetical protein